MKYRLVKIALYPVACMMFFVGWALVFLDELRERKKKTHEQNSRLA